MEVLWHLPIPNISYIDRISKAAHALQNIHKIDGLKEKRKTTATQKYDAVSDNLAPVRDLLVPSS